MCWLADRHARAVVVALVLGGTAGACARPQGALFDTPGKRQVWPQPPEPGRVKFVGTIADSDDLHAAVSGMEAFKTALRGPRPPIRLLGPNGVAVRDPNQVAIADTNGAAVHILDLEARTHHKVNGWQDERFGAPVGIAWAGGQLFVTDAERHEVIELDAVGGFHKSFGGGVLTRPVGIAYVPQRDRLYVVDGGAHCLKVFDRSGATAGTIGRHGVEPGEFHFPTHVAVRDDTLLVSDSGNSRVQLLDLDGQCLRTIGRRGDAAGDFALPKGVAFDSDGHLYVVDAHFENIQIFNREGQLLLAVGQEGAKPGEFSLPAGLAIDGKDRIWVADSGNGRMQVLAYLKAEL